MFGSPRWYVHWPLHAAMWCPGQGPTLQAGSRRPEHSGTESSKTGGMAVVSLNKRSALGGSRVFPVMQSPAAAGMHARHSCVSVSLYTPRYVGRPNRRPSRGHRPSAACTCFVSVVACMLACVRAWMLGETKTSQACVQTCVQTFVQACVQTCV